MLKKLKDEQKEFARLSELVNRYKLEIPPIRAIWDTSPESLEFCSINPDCPEVQNGVTIYTCSREDLFNGFKSNHAQVHRGKIMWGNKKNNHKIAMVIEAWEQGRKISPVFILKTSGRRKPQVVDGHHRLTVAEKIEAPTIPIVVQGLKPSWVKKAFKTATLECEVLRDEMMRHLSRKRD